MLKLVIIDLDDTIINYMYAHSIAFENLMHKISSEFNVDYKLTDNYYIKDLQKNIKEKFEKNKKDWLNAYYYLTNSKFSDLKKIQIKKNDSELEDKTYFELFNKELKWYSFYAMDWISQINFYNHFINL